MRHSLRFGQIVVCWLALGSAACGTRQDVPQVSLSKVVTDSTRTAAAAQALLAPAAQAALDSGNVLYRKKAFTAALARYREAATLAPQHAAPLFGVYMVARAISDTAMADSALAGIRKRNGPLPSNPHAVLDAMVKKAPAGTQNLPQRSR
jgi:hypothetical protein